MEVVALHVRTVAAALIWVAVVLLFLNSYFKSELIWLIAIAMAITAVLVYFLPRLRKGHTHTER